VSAPDTVPGVLDACRIEPGTDAGLDRRPTDDRLGIEKGAAQEKLAALTARLSVLHQRLYAESARSVLLVLQGLDAAGKDGTIRRVFTGLNPQGCDVVAFKAPSSTELKHDYLWRIHTLMPERGDIRIFNRSHYEDVVAAEIVGVIGDKERKRRYEHINSFEKMLLDEGTSIVKLFLHVGKDEQRKRLQARLDDPEKRWKFDRADLDARAAWDRYLTLYDAAITATSTKWAPWHVVPADHKWVSGVAAAAILLDTLETMDPKIPPPQTDLDGITIT
jgi:PPK2 family polyphosphate:nucleotide phosphotransferase